MSIFQKSVIQKHLANLDTAQVAIAFHKLKENYSPAKIEQIKELKEEEYQDGFLRDIFVDVLGYTFKPNENYNLAREYKNLADSKKADGAILKDDKAIAVIELKSVKTKDLKSITDQAFNYKNNQPECKYVITSNFQKLRFYIDYANEYEEFDLFNIEKEDFDLLYLLLSKEGIFQNLPLKLKEETKFHDQIISAKLYKDYSQFKRKLYENLCKNHPESDKLTLFKKSQKLLDRFLFILFAEDRQLLPPNSISRIVERFDLLKDEDAYKPLYEIFKQYFGYMNSGRKGKTSDGDIPAYNGGLFYPDKLLDGFTIDDDVLIADLMNLSEYDFSAEVDVNILGHIFEHSLNEIEEVTAEIEGVTHDKSKSKRKKDGIFYTPKYITQYIVENTIGTLCTEKRKELDIETIEVDGSYQTKDKNLTVKGKKLYQKLTRYKEWLIGLKIIDPACGSGAFLNQALNFLIEEHKTIDDIIAELTNTPLRLFDVDKSILENNLYGVDINEESVEIAKLSLWLRTAQKGRMLSTLNNNIKCGNSLIDDPEVAGDKAFDWNKEFPEIMKKGGFDVVIGNPPYVRAELLGEYIDYFKSNFDVFNPASDLFAYFYELGSKLINKNGVLGYISNTFDKTTAGKVLREYLAKHTTFIKYIDFTEVQVFDGATTYPVIIILNKNTPDDTSLFKYIKIPKLYQSVVIDIDFHNAVQVDQDTLEPDSWAFLPIEKFKLLKRINGFPNIREKYGKCYRGLITGLNEAFLVKDSFPISNHLKYIYEGKEIKKWHTPKPEQKLILFKSNWTKATYGSSISEDDAINKLKGDFRELSEILSPFEENAKKRYDKGDFWWELRNCAYYDLFEDPKIIFPNLQNGNKFCLDSEGVYINAPAVFLPVASKPLLCVLNSKIVWEFLKSICVVRSGGYIEVKPQYFEQIPIPNFSNEEVFEVKANKIISKTSDLQNIQSKLLKYLQSKFPIKSFSKKLQNWYNLDFGEFITELNKAIKTVGRERLSKSEEMDWMEVFESKKVEAQILKAEIAKTDKEIDQMVYALYELTEEEIAIVEGSVK